MKKTLEKENQQCFKAGDGGLVSAVSVGLLYCSIGVNRPDCQHSARFPDYRAKAKGRNVTHLGDKKNHKTGRFRVQRI